MPGRAKSKTKKAQIERENIKDARQRAVQLYLAELENPDEKQRKGARTICAEVSAAFFVETGSHIHLDHNTLIRHAKGGKSIDAFNQEKCLLKQEEIEKVIEVSEELADRNIPLTHKTLKQYVDLIIRARDPEFKGVGVNWTDRFVERHSDRLKMFNSSPLDTARNRAVNPISVAAWFKLLQTLFEKHGHGDDPECLYGLDETGFMPGRAVTQKVIGKAMNKTQGQKESGNRELITVVPAICADGTSVPPLVIFSGQAYSVAWKQENPLNASMGYSQKGYIDGEILEEWIKHFDQYTKRKAGGRPQYIFLDGHKSRLHLPFLLYCRDNNIHIVCYPSHSTHVFQGLDVVIFSVLKRAFTDEMLKFEERTGYGVSKSNFLSVYTPAHTRSFFGENIKMAFAKTGIYPFNPNVISISAMKPSIESSTFSNGLPLTQPSPVRAVAKLFATRKPKEPLGILVEEDTENLDLNSSMDLTRHITDGLIGTSAGFLVSLSPIKSTSTLPLHVSALNIPYIIPTDVLLVTPSTSLEEKLQMALTELIQRESNQYGTMVGLQASMVLQSVYCEKLRGQLFAKENAKRKKKGTGKLMDDGLPRCLTGDEFIKKVQEFAQRQVDEEITKDRKRQLREMYTATLAEWKILDSERKKREKDRTMRFAAATKLWKEEQAKAKAEKRPPCLAKPIREPREASIPKPTKPTEDEDNQEYIDINIDDNEDGTDGEDGY